MGARPDARRVEDRDCRPAADHQAGLATPRQRTRRFTRGHRGRNSPRVRPTPGHRGRVSKGPVPETAVVDGKPQGIFVGRSLLTGRAVCLLFLGGGRITRFIPTGGLENFDWARHQAQHGGDSGTWEMAGGQIRITWGDGGIHQGPLTVRPTGIAFYGKRYSKPATAKLSDLVGRWEAASGTAVTGGEGVNRLRELTVDPDGRYRWTTTTGGVVAGRAASGATSRSGILKISGATITLTADDGTVTTHTFLPVQGEPLAAFGLDADLFTRMN